MIKKIYCVLLLCLFISSSSQIGLAPVYAKNTLTSYTYARVMSDNVSLYKTPSVSNTDNVYFELPKSYFVLLISNFSTDFYKAQYRDVVGFVLKDSVTAVEETPMTPYLTDVTFRVFSSDGGHLMSSPYSSSTRLLDVNLSSNLDYYGMCYGEELIDGRGSTWYYTKVGDTYGYLYSGLCDRLSSISTNNEHTTPKNNPFGDSNNDYLYSIISMSPLMQGILILLVSLPAIFILILLFKPQKKTSKLSKISKSKAKNEINKEVQNEENY